MYLGGPQVITPITGNIDTTVGTMSIDPFQFFIFILVTSLAELLGPGIYTRTDNFGGTNSATIGPGQLSAWALLEWTTNQGMATYMV